MTTPPLALPSSVQFDSVNRTFSGTTDTTIGSYTLKVVASDGNGGSATGYFTWTVAANARPSYSGGIPDQTFVINTAFATDPFAEGAFTDLDNDPLTYTATLGNGDSLPACIHVDPATGTVHGTAPGYETQVYMKVIATDGDEESDYGGIILNVVFRSGTESSATFSGSHTVSAGSWFSPDPNLSEYGPGDWGLWNSPGNPRHRKNAVVGVLGDLWSRGIGLPEGGQVAGQFVWDAGDSTSASPAGPDVSNPPANGADGAYWWLDVTLPQPRGQLSVWAFNVNEGDPDVLRLEVVDGVDTVLYTSGDMANAGGTADYRFDLPWSGAAAGDQVRIKWIYASKTGDGRLGFMGVAQELSMPAVATAAVTSIGTTAADCGGDVLDEGYGSVTVRGVCWNTTGEPTTTDPHTTDGSGPGAFDSSLTDLHEETTYHARAYATNANGRTLRRSRYVPGLGRHFRKHQL